MWNDERGRNAEIFEKRIRESKWQRMTKFKLGNGIRGGGVLGRGDSGCVVYGRRHGSIYGRNTRCDN